MKADMERSGRGNARSWLNVGVQVENPEPGDVVVFWRGSPRSHKGHVGIFQGYSRDQRRIYVLGGNQDDQVSTTAYPTERLLGFRRLRPEGAAALPTPPLQRGSRGRAVTQLQDALKLACFNPGTSDGIFGPRTEEAVEQLQATDDRVAISGTYDDQTAALLEEILATR